MSFGWAYINCTASGGSGGGQAAGPPGSIQFLTGTNATSGSSRLVYHTAAYGGYAASTMVLTGAFVVRGEISASSYHIKDVSRIEASGSTFFGNTNDDVHIRTGSITITNTSNEISLNVNTSGRTDVRQLTVEYTPVTSSTYTASHPAYILGVQATGQVNIQLPTPVGAPLSGNVIMVKDELVASRAGNNITLRTAAGTIDGSATYVLTGTMPAISLYSNGANWFVF